MEVMNGFVRDPEPVISEKSHELSGLTRTRDEASAHRKDGRRTVF